MSEEKTSIGPWLYWSLITISTLSYGLLNLPYYATKVMGANAYLAIPIGAILSLPALFGIYRLMAMFPKLGLVEVGLKIFGPIIGRLFGVGYLLSLLLILVIFTRDTVNLVFSYLMDDTPLLVLVTIYLLTAAYLASRGIETISRLASFMLLPILAVISLLMLGVFADISINRLLPVFHPEIKTYLPGGASVINAFYPLAVVGLITPYLRGIREKIPRLTLYGGLILVIFYMLFTIGSIGIFGHEYLGRFAYPGLESIHAVEFPYFLIEQAGLFMVTAWISIVMVGSGFLYYALALGTSQVTGFLDYKRFVWLFLPLKVYLIMFPQNVGETKLFFQYIDEYGWIPLFGFPLLLYLFALLFKKRGWSA